MRRASWVWLAAGLLTTWGAWAWFFPRAPRLEPLARPEPGTGPMVVLVPHPDDEALAAGGLLQQAEAAGGRPQVVLVTGGDAFKVAAQAHFRRAQVSRADLVAFGRHRVEESRAALAALGLPPGRLTFLGYPDQGLHRLWLECWRVARPCTAPLTGAAAVPYAEARTPGAPFAGAALLRELTALLREWRPTVVAYPHPNETHVDHWALANFAAAALAELQRTEPGWRPPAQWLYLVHRGDWPAPKGYRPTAPLLPPGKLAGGMTTWRTEPLTPQQVERKAAAVGAYRSQVALLRRYMHSFIRANELFGTIAPARLPPPGRPAARPPGAPPWPGLAWAQVLTDPQGDTVARQVERGADLLGLWAATDGDLLHLAARLAAPLRAPAEVRLYARGFRAGPGWGDLAEAAVSAGGAHRVQTWPGPGAAPPLRAEAAGAWVRLGLPLGALGAPQAVLLGAETRVDGILIDRAAWRPLSLDGR